MIQGNYMVFSFCISSSFLRPPYVPNSPPCPPTPLSVSFTGIKISGQYSLTCDSFRYLLLSGYGSDFFLPPHLMSSVPAASILYIVQAFCVMFLLYVYRNLLLSTGCIFEPTWVMCARAHVLSACTWCR